MKARGRSRPPWTTTRRSRAWTSPVTTSAMKARSRSRRPSTTTRRSRAWTSTATTSARTSRTSWETAFASTSSFPRSPCGSPPQWRGASSSGTTFSSSRLLSPPALAFGDELLDLQLPDRNNLWLSPGGRDFAAAYLLPRAEAALRQELQRLADAAKRAREGQSSSSSSDERLARAVTARGLVGEQRRG